MSDVEPRQWWIYALIEPRPDHARAGEPRYVGKSVKPNRRLSAHLCEVKREMMRDANRGGMTHKQRWLRAVLKTGLEPSIELLESGSGSKKTWIDAESKWIAEYQAQGYSLTNATAGGEGLHGYSHTLDTRAKIAAANTGRVFDLETRAKMSAALKGRIISTESRAKMSASGKGKAISAETRAKMSAAAAGKPKTLEQRAKQSAVMKGRTASAKTRAKMSASQTGRVHSLETRAKMSASAKAYCARRALETLQSESG